VRSGLTLFVLLALSLAGCAAGGPPPAAEETADPDDDLAGSDGALADPDEGAAGVPGAPSTSGSSTSAVADGSPSSTASPPPNVPTGPTRPAATAPWSPRACDPGQPTERTINAWRLPGLQGSHADVAARLATRFGDAVSEASGPDDYRLASNGSVRFRGSVVEASGYTDWVGVEGPAGLAAVSGFLDSLWSGWRSAIILEHDGEHVYDRPDYETGERVRQDPYIIRQPVEARVPDGAGGWRVLSDDRVGTGSVLRHEEGNTRIHLVSLDGLHEPAVLGPALSVPQLEGLATGYARCHLDSAQPSGYTLSPVEWADYPLIHWSGDEGTVSAYLTVPYRLADSSGERLLEMRLDLGTGAILSAKDGATRYGLG
jgi:hypothetical protein